MNKIIYCLLLIVCIVAIPICALGYMDTMVTEKYQVDHARMFVEMDSNKLSEIEKTTLLDNIQKLENSIQYQQSMLLTFGLLACLGIVFLFIKLTKMFLK